MSDQPATGARRVTVTLSGNRLALALGVLAVVIASTGTAVAVTLTKTTIADPKVPSRVARVDGTGHLSVAGKVAVAGTVTAKPATLSISAYTNVSTPGTGAKTPLTSPTTATLAVSKVVVTNPHANTGASNAVYTMSLIKVSVDPATKQCSPSDFPTPLARFDVAPGDVRDLTFPVPLVVGPTAGKAYCLSLFGTTSNGQTDTGDYYAYAYLYGYAVSGTYKGNGVPGTPAAAGPGARKTVR